MMTVDNLRSPINIDAINSIGVSRSKSLEDTLKRFQTNFESVESKSTMNRRNHKLHSLEIICVATCVLFCMLLLLFPNNLAYDVTVDPETHFQPSSLSPKKLIMVLFVVVIVVTIAYLTFVKSFMEA